MRVVLSLLLVLAACGAPRPRVATDSLDCPARPNCVSSQSSDEAHRVEPFVVHGAAGFACLVHVLGDTPRTRIVLDTPTHVHAEVHSLLFRFVDDVDLVHDPASGRVAVRSASRTGYSDLGVNRRRVEALRARFSSACRE